MQLHTQITILLLLLTLAALLVQSAHTASLLLLGSVYTRTDYVFNKVQHSTAPAYTQLTAAAEYYSKHELYLQHTTTKCARALVCSEQQ